VHGANRLASNSLLEGLVFGARAGKAMLAESPARPHACPEPQMPVCAPDPEAGCRQLRQLMSRHAGIIRFGKQLRQLAERLAQRLAEPLEMAAGAQGAGAQKRSAHKAAGQRAGQGPRIRQAFEFRNMLMVGEMIARSAAAREESRGAHYRSDFPFKVERFQKHSYIGPGMKVSFR
jgi:L-aspartate oxidase